MTDSLSGDLASIVDHFDHVSMAVHAPEDAAALLSLLGGRHVDGGYESRGDFSWSQYRLPGDARLEVISTASTDPDHFINRFLDQRGPGLHHLTFRVDDLASARDEAERRGFEVVGYDDADASWKELFLHPASANGILIQLAEFPEKAT